MQYKTKGNAPPAGKPRIYFTCHPKDFTGTFEQVCEDIFQTQDCVVCYAEDMTADIDLVNQDGEMDRSNLFVIPVTYALLTSPNRAMDQDLPYAQKNHIPVLPIMMEPELDSLFALPGKFGAMQYINPTSTDETEIAYKDKLEKYLNSVLIGGETAKRIREAFDAYIFLSYRKKDRRYANELMRMIHRNPEYRDIAIWFDEFLTPGENFRDSIDSILSSSKFFTLLVTPNILEEPEGKPNFVMGQEYPAAQLAGMDILPVEMEATDKTALTEKFKDIPECVDAHNDGLFRQRLLDALSRAAITVQGDDPEHMFLIGLAYLDGIDVETNREKGLELITAAAEQELPEAMEKLATMYYYGTGVSVDYPMTEKWLLKLVDHATKIHSENHAWVLGLQSNLGLLYSAMGKDQQALDAWKKVYTARKENLGPEDEDTIHAMWNVGTAYSSIGNHKEGIKYLENAYAIGKDALGEDHLDVIATLSHLADIHISQGYHYLAKTQLEKLYATLRKKMGEEHKETTTVMNNLAVVYSQIGENGEALELAKQAYTILRKTYTDDHPEMFSFINTMAVCYENLGDHERALDLRKNLLRDMRKTYGETHPRTLSAMCNLSFTYKHLGDPTHCLRLREKVYDLQKTHLGEAHVDTIAMIRNLALVYCETGNPQHALEITLNGYTLCCSKFGEDHPQAFSLALTLAEIYTKLEDHHSAKLYAEKVYTLYQKLQDAHHSLARETLAVLMAVYRNLQDFPKSLEIQEQLLSLDARHLRKDHPHYLTDLYNLAMAYHSAGSMGKAKEHMKHAYTLYRSAYGEAHPETLEVAGMLSMFYSACGDFEDALKLSQEIAAIRKKSKKEASSAKTQKQAKKRGR